MKNKAFAGALFNRMPRLGTAVMTYHARFSFKKACQEIRGKPLSFVTVASSDNGEYSWSQSENYTFPGSVDHYIFNGIFNDGSRHFVYPCQNVVKFISV